MKAVIVCGFQTYFSRAKLLKNAYEKKGYRVTIVATDFDHATKTRLTELESDVVYLKTRPYRKNLSPQRLISHHIFAKDVFKYLGGIEFDLLHVFIPPNSLAKAAVEYKRSNPCIDLRFDLIDLWPETMPINKFKKTFPFEYWRKLRDNYIEKANVVYTECDLYQKVLKKENDKKFKTLYWIKPKEERIHAPQLSDDEINLCYLGSINNIIDIDYIVRLCNVIDKYKSCRLHIIGDGERKGEFLEKLATNNISYMDYGVIYDPLKKQEIFDHCHFGLNIMKSTVCVGLTMKSLDYFLGGLPIINNLQGDTSAFVEYYNVGYNGIEEYEAHIGTLTKSDYLKMRNNVTIMYNEKFTEEAFYKSLFE